MRCEASVLMSIDEAPKWPRDRTGAGPCDDEIWAEFVLPAIAAAGGQMDGESPAEAVARGLGMGYMDMMRELRAVAAGGGAW